jgi:hypothetical protein
MTSPNACPAELYRLWMEEKSKVLFWKCATAVCLAITVIASGTAMFFVARVHDCEKQLHQKHAPTPR